jgi:hypothetical protein
MTKFYQNILKEPTRLELVKLRAHSGSYRYDRRHIT